MHFDPARAMREAILTPTRGPSGHAEGGRPRLRILALHPQGPRKKVNGRFEFERDKPV
jgi:hypothetical protein